MRVSFGDVVFDSDERCVRRAGTLLHLSPKAFDLLALLVRERPRAVRKQDIVDALWPDVFVEEANVRNLVAEIRAALGETAEGAIVTLPRVGYAFRGESRRDARASHCSVVVGGIDFELPDGATLVGRADDCGVRIRTSGVSRQHLRITVNRSGAVVEDLGSKNGTWLNGQHLTTAVALRDGDELCLGAAVMKVRLAAAASPTTTIIRGLPHEGE